MNTRLLSIIKSEQERRNAPAVLAINEKTGRESPFEKDGLGKLWIVLRAIRTVFHVISNFSTLKGGGIILPRKGHKYDEVEEELIEAGLKKKHISKTYGEPTFSSQIYAAKTILECLIAGIAYYNRKNAFKYFEVLFLYTALNKWLLRHKKSSIWVIIGDLSPDLISLAAACKYAGHSVIYWQYSLLDFKHLSVDADVAIILNNAGIELSKISSDKDFYWRDIDTVETIDTDNISKGPVGILLNVHAHEKVWERIFSIQNKIGLPCEVRFHPNSTLAIPELPEEITIADKSESLESFADRISLAVCGNTQAQAKLMMMGVPVVQLEGLDQLYFDFHGYVQRDIVPGIRHPEEFNMSELVEFYHSEKYKLGLNNLIGPTGESRKPSLESFVDTFTKSDS